MEGVQGLGLSHAPLCPPLHRYIKFLAIFFFWLSTIKLWPLNRSILEKIPRLKWNINLNGYNRRVFFYYEHFFANYEPLKKLYTILGPYKAVFSRNGPHQSPHLYSAKYFYYSRFPPCLRWAKKHWRREAKIHLFFSNVDFTRCK